MKRKALIFLAMTVLVIIAAIACSKKRIPVSSSDIIPTSTITPAYTSTQVLSATATRTRTPSPTISPTHTVTPPPPDNSLYPYEDGTTMNWTFMLNGTTRTANSTEMAFRGTHSLRIDGVFTTAGGSSGAGTYSPLVTNVNGMKIIGRIYVPLGFSGGGTVFIQSGSGWCWQSGTWLNFTPGTWNEIVFDPTNPGYTDTSKTPDHADVKVIGVGFLPSAAFSGSLFIDTLEIVSLGSPTITRTISPSPTISPTATSTRTPGGPTETITPTHTISPTITITQTTISTPISPASMGANIQYYGRWDMTAAAQPKNGWGTTYLVAGFEGTSIAVNISAWDTWFTYAIDGDILDHNNFTKFRIRNESDALATPVPVFTQTPYVIKGLADTSHTIMIVRRSDGNSGKIKFNGFGLDTGKTMTSPSYTVPARKMEFIGDSITCGSDNEYAAAVPTPDCLYGGCIQNGDMAFGPQLARLCGAEWRTISRGGIGIYRNCGAKCDPQIMMPAIYPNLYFETSGTGPAWNFSSWKPDMVVIAIGTNDFYEEITPTTVPKTFADKALFQAAYSGFLTTIRTNYPDAYILCTQPVPTWGNQLDDAGPYIQEVVTNKADPKIYYVMLNKPTPINANFPLSAADYANDNTHPIITAHTKIAEALKAWIDSHPAIVW